MRVTLQVLEGPDRGRAYEFRGYQAFVLGRSVGAGSGMGIPQDPYFSRYHLLLEFSARGCFLRDLGSRNGTFVNDARVEQAALSTGDRIRAGRTLMQILIEPQAPSDGPEDLEGHPLRRSLSEFRLGRLLGQGAMGLVHEAVDVGTGEAVAIKLLRPGLRQDPVAVRHFARETTVVSRLVHPRVVGLRAVGSTAESLWYAMDLCRGPTLEARIGSVDMLDVREGLEVGVQLLEALVHSHGMDIVHRDIKPGNVLYRSPDPTGGVVLADFGLAKMVQETGLSPITATGDAKGTPLFMAPEQILNAKQAGPRADLFGWAATIYAALSGGWHGGDLPTGSSAWKDALDRPSVPLRKVRPEVPAGCAGVIDRCLSRDPSRRPASAGETLSALVAATKAGAGMKDTLQ